MPIRSPLLFLFCLILSLGVPAQGAKKIKRKSKTTESIIKKPRQTPKPLPLSGEISATHVMGFTDTSDPVTEFSIRGSWTPKLGNSFSLIQPMTKLYVISPDNNEFLLLDTIINYSRSLTTSTSAIVGLSLPVSEFSQSQGVITKPSLKVRYLSKDILDGFSLSVTPAIIYYVNQYQTTISKDGAGGGKPLRQMTAGVSLVGTYRFTHTLSLSLMAGWSRIFYEEIDLKNADTDSSETNIPDLTYVYDLSLTYALNESLSIAGGLSHGDRVEKYGGIEINAFDPYITQWYLSTALTF